MIDKIQTAVSSEFHTVVEFRAKLDRQRKNDDKNVESAWRVVYLRRNAVDYYSAYHCIQNLNGGSRVSNDNCNCDIGCHYNVL